MLTVRLMTLNLRVSSMDDGPNMWQERWPHVLDMIKALNPDVLGVQECMPNQLVAIMGETPGYFSYPGPDTMLPDGVSLRNPVFVCQPCNLPLSEGALALNDSGVIGQLSWNGKEPRLAHIFRFKGWTLVNTHFDAWDCTEARLESAKLLTETLRDEPAVVVMGDLNCTPDEPPIQVFREAGYTLAKDALPPGTDRTTFHGFTGQGMAEVDYILLRGAALKSVQIPRPRKGPPYLSDHDPVMADIEIDDV
jgi:endonuclease/exonuclease/phosphatase family metal-dependent hydrolase